MQPALQLSVAAPSINLAPANGRKLPMSTFIERYVAGDIKVSGDLQAFFRRKEEVLNYRLTLEQLKFLVGGFIPSVLVHTPAADRKTVTGHYDRGNDFFGWFLGERMVYTSGFFENPGPEPGTGPGQQAEPGLPRSSASSPDTGCWTSAAAGAPWPATRPSITARTAPASPSPSVRPSSATSPRPRNGASADKARVLCTDYREIPKQKFDPGHRQPRDGRARRREEPAGLLRDRARSYIVLTDDGWLALIQWTGLRRGLRPRGPHLGSVHGEASSVPGADAQSLPPRNGMIKAIRKRPASRRTAWRTSASTTSWTIQRWGATTGSAIARPWPRPTASAGTRIWNFFLAWSVVIAEQGNASCFQVVMEQEPGRLRPHALDRREDPSGRVPQVLSAMRTTKGALPLEYLLNLRGLPLRARAGEGSLRRPPLAHGDPGPPAREQQLSSAARPYSRATSPP